MAMELVGVSKGPESDYAFEFEEPAYLTLGLCYEQRPRFSGGAYQSVLRRVETFADDPVILETRKSPREHIESDNDEDLEILGALPEDMFVRAALQIPEPDDENPGDATA